VYQTEPGNPQTSGGFVGRSSQSHHQSLTVEIDRRIGTQLRLPHRGQQLEDNEFHRMAQRSHLAIQQLIESGAGPILGGRVKMAPPEQGNGGSLKNYPEAIPPRETAMVIGQGAAHQTLSF